MPLTYIPTLYLISSVSSKIVNTTQNFSNADVTMYSRQCGWVVQSLFEHLLDTHCSDPYCAIPKLPRYQSARRAPGPHSLYTYPQILSGVFWAHPLLCTLFHGQILPHLSAIVRNGTQSRTSPPRFFLRSFSPSHSLPSCPKRV